MDFVAIVLFLFVYYIRPHEWPYGLGGLRPVQLTMAFAVLTLVLREKTLRVSDVLKTPHDWFMGAYFAWIICTSPTPIRTLIDISAAIVIYIVTVQTLVDVERIKRYLYWWSFMIMIVAALAVASAYGFDPLDSYDLTQFKMKGRLVLNLSIFDNPNALGHSVVPAIPMVFFLMIWKRPLFIRQVAAGILTLLLSCIYMTVSKGSFISGFVTTVSTLTFGRTKFVQIVIVLCAVSFGWSALYLLPRMHELDEAQTDEAIMGRLAAYKFGLNTLKHNICGFGWDNWLTAFHNANGYYKAAHGSYNMVGGELGFPGLYLFLGVIYCSLRTLITAKNLSIEEDRVRKVLLVLILSYAISSWMVDFGRRATFFMMTASTAAFHRRIYRVDDFDMPLETAVQPQPASVLASSVETKPDSSGPAIQRRVFAEDPEHVEEVVLPVLPVKPWMKIGIQDALIILLMTIGTVEFWEYIIVNL